MPNPQAPLNQAKFNGDQNDQNADACPPLLFQTKCLSKWNKSSQHRHQKPYSLIREPETQHFSAMFRSFLVAAVIAPLGEASKIPATLPNALDTRRLFCAMCPGDGPNHI